MEMDTARPLADHYWFIEGNQAVAIDLPAAEFWSQLTGGSAADGIVRTVAEADGWLVTAYDMVETMQSSEMHPEGDELHYLASGRLDLVLEHDDGERVVELHPGSGAVVRKGVWHRFVVHEPGRGIALTFGRGTQHRPVQA
ncbi:MAG TPA: cupin domain-containing protein [Acidimicrobiia bacterium]